MPVAEISATGPEPADQAIEALESLPGDGDACPGQRIRRAAAASQRVAESVARVDRRRRACARLHRRRGQPPPLRADRRPPAGRRRSCPSGSCAEMRRSIDLLARVAPPSADALRAFKEAFERRFADAQRATPRGARSGLRHPARRRARRAGRRAGRRTHADRGAGGRCSPCIARGTSAPDADGGAERGRRRRALRRARSGQLPGAFAMLTSLIGAMRRRRDGRLPARRAGDHRAVGRAPARPALPRRRGARGARARAPARAKRRSIRTPSSPSSRSRPRPRSASTSPSDRVLSEWEIEYGGASGAPPDRRHRSRRTWWSRVEDGEVVLRSRVARQARDPLLHDGDEPELGLAAGRAVPALDRTAARLRVPRLELGRARPTRPALPRVTHGRTILALRRWNVPPAELADVRAGTDAAGFRRLQEWRDDRGLPRLVSFDHPKSRVLVDFDNVLSVDAFLAAAKDARPRAPHRGAGGRESPVRGSGRSLRARADRPVHAATARAPLDPPLDRPTRR